MNRTSFESREALLEALSHELDMRKVRIVGDTIFYSDGSASSIRQGANGRWHLDIACTGSDEVMP